MSPSKFSLKNKLRNQQPLFGEHYFKTGTVVSDFLGFPLNRNINLPALRVHTFEVKGTNLILNHIFHIAT